MAVIEAPLGTQNNGNGLNCPLQNAGVPGGTTFQNVAAKGALLVDTTNGKLYINTGTQAAPTWTVVGTQT
jgi:hypothetical protein